MVIRMPKVAQMAGILVMVWPSKSYGSPDYVELPRALFTLLLTPAMFALSLQLQTFQLSIGFS